MSSEAIEEHRMYLRIFMIVHCIHILFDNLLNNDQEVDEHFKSQICGVITNQDSFCINCENNIPHELNADITLSVNALILSHMYTYGTDLSMKVFTAGF